MNERNEAEIKAICDTIRQAAYQIHLYFGTGFLEKVYENTLKHRLEKLGLDVKAQVRMVVHDKRVNSVSAHQPHFVVEDEASGKGDACGG